MRSRLPPAAILTLCSAFLPASPAPVQAPAVPQVQGAPPAAPVFDVAAIHQHIPEPHEHNSIWSSPFDGHFKASNVSLIMLIHWAFEMPDTRILSAPGWASTTRFNIDAEADSSIDAQMKGLSSDAGRQQKEKMVQALLADRFRLVMHKETRELPIYALVVTKGGPKFGTIKEQGTTVNTGNGRIEVQASNSVAAFAEELSDVVGRDVIDKTGIQGRYDLKLKWTPDDRAAPLSNASGGDASATDSGPSIFTALQEQLGLKLESQKGLVSVLVVDRAEMPSEN
jgi:uncharacterized protein (TIGR03435 family)